MIHKYSLNGINIVIDVNSGSVHIVEPPVFDALEYFETKSKREITDILKEKHGADKLSEAYDEISELVSQGLLFSADEYENLTRSASAAVKNPVVKALCLLVSQDCNMRCGYCFAGGGIVDGGRALMTAETGKKAVDFLIKSSGARRNLEIDFFGGEPLMNFGAVKEIVAYARGAEKERGKNIRFTLTTNGLLLDDEKLEFINKEIKNIVLSVDGRKDVNDAMRKTSGGRGTYGAILPMFKKTAESRGHENYYVRGTFTRFNKDFANDVIHLADEGFKQISVEPVVGNDGAAFALTAEDLPEIFAEYEKIADELIKRHGTDKQFNFFHYNIDLEGGPCVAKRLAGCGAGTEYLAVAADGSLYPCHQFAGQPEFRMGSLGEGVTNVGLRSDFINCSVYTKEKCRACFAKFYCGGGCAANAYNENKTIYEPYSLGCEMQRKRTECAIYVKAAETAE